MKKTKPKKRIRLTAEAERAARILEHAHAGVNHDGWVDCDCIVANAIKTLRNGLAPALPYGYGELRVRMPQSTVDWLSAFAYPRTVDEVLPGLLLEAMMAGRTAAQQQMTKELGQRWRESIAPDAPENLTPVTHILYGGFAMCGFSRKAPQCWPSNNSWVTLEQYEREGTMATCVQCMTVASQKGMAQPR